MEAAPKLIEPNAHQFLFQTLKHCHTTRVETYSWLWNAIIAGVVIVGSIITLYLCAKCKKTAIEEKEQLFQEQSFILDKIRAFKELDSHHKQTSSLTKLPFPMDNGPVIE